MLGIVPVIDVVVVGGGPAGLSAAIMAKQAGLDVVVFEAKAGTIDKACGEGLMPKALLALDRMGVARPAGMPFNGIRYVDDSGMAQATFSMGPGLGVRRTELYRVLRSRVDELGISVRVQRVKEWSQDDAGVTVEGCRARWMFAADGLRSPIRAQLGLGAEPRFPPRLGIRRHFAVAPWAEFVEIHWSPLAEAYVTPVGPNEVGVAILYSPDAQPPGAGDPFSRWMNAFPALSARLGEPVSEARGAGPFEQRVKTPMEGRILLIGDAAGYLDPITGEGIRLGLYTANAAVQAVVSSRIESYPAMCRPGLRRYWILTSGLLFIRRRDWLRRRLVPFLARFPRIFRFALDSLNHA